MLSATCATFLFFYSIAQHVKVLFFKKNGKITFYENGEDYLLYDFTVEVGDTVAFYIPSNAEYYKSNPHLNNTATPVRQLIIITDIDSIKTDENKWIKKFTTEILENHTTDTCYTTGIIYEGIGSSLGIFGRWCWVATFGCHGALHCFYSNEVNLNFSDYYCNPETIEYSDFNGSETWLYTQWDLTPTEKINSVKGDNKVLIENKICHEFNFYNGHTLKPFSNLILFYKDSIVQFYDGLYFKTLYDFRQKNVGDTVKYYLPFQTPLYDISSSQGAFSPDTNAYYYKVIGIETVFSDEGKEIKKYAIEPAPNELYCYEMGNAVLENIGSASGLLGKACSQLTSGFPEYFRCFQSDYLNYNALNKNCELSSTNEIFTRVKIHPNPSNNNITLDSEVPFDYIELTNLQGENVLSTKIYTNTIDITYINSGIYILKLKHNNRITARSKLVVMK